MLHFFIFLHKQTQSNREYNSYIILLLLMLTIIKLKSSRNYGVFLYFFQACAFVWLPFILRKSYRKEMPGLSGYPLESLLQVPLAQCLVVPFLSTHKSIFNLVSSNNCIKFLKILQIFAGYQYVYWLMCTC
jgi:hypothetical protein